MSSLLVLLLAWYQGLCPGPQCMLHTAIAQLQQHMSALRLLSQRNSSHKLACVGICQLSNQHEAAASIQTRQGSDND
jgi:hypothetical protein